MKDLFILNLSRDIEKIKYRWEAVKFDNPENPNIWKSEFFKIFGSIGDALLTSFKYSSNSCKIVREFAIILEPDKADCDSFNYVLIYVMYNKEKVDGLFSYQNNYVEIKRYILGQENLIWEDLSNLTVRYPDYIV